jgi:catechol 2,3-dioxygenase-like lactoylglutathione lyase family enzyme
MNALQQARLDHVGLTVPDIDAATDFFAALLGARRLFEIGPFASSDDWLAVNLRVDPRATIPRLRMLALPDGGLLELFEYTGPNTGVNHPANSQVGGYHVAFRVPDIDAAVARAKAMGLEIQGDVKLVGDGPSKGLRWVYFLAPWGLQLEFASYPERWAGVS